MSDPIAKIKETKDIPLDLIEIGIGQFRTRNVEKNIDELAENIRTVGLLNPITVVENKEGKYELIAGQRRFLAHKQIGADTIRANILEKDLDEYERKIISVTENITITPPSREDYIDACTALYRKYGTIRAVAEKLGLNYSTVSDYVHYDQLIEPLKEFVDKGVVDLKTAKRAQEAAVSYEGGIDEEAAIAYAKEMRTMSGEGQKRMLNVAKKMMDAEPAEIIEKGREQAAVTTLRIVIANDINDSLKQYADTEGTKTDDAASTLIEEGLEQKGYLKKTNS
ncbi:MAG: ParB/RepB/Spo0J family partition protein [Candidatus Bathyarchaeota archaeon]|nr:ParB/RepB/Spo0J family partition protein [Candidatus Bathyarchaeota archaeon]